MKGQKVFFTGGTSGLGKVALCELAAQGANVIALARSTEKGTALVDHYKVNHPQGKGSIEIVLGDLLSFQSVSDACAKVREKTDRLDQIVQNAGIMNFSWKKSTDGIEQTLQVNLLAPVLITHLLVDLLAKSDQAKLIFTASALHKGIIHFEDLEFEKKFVSFKSYSQSKLGIILMARLLAKKLASDGIAVYSQHPGMVKTQLGRDAGWLSRAIFNLMGTSPEKGAQTLIFLAKAGKGQLVSGEYYAKKKVEKITAESNDLEVAEKLLAVAKEYLGEGAAGSSLIF